MAQGKSRHLALARPAKTRTALWATVLAVLAALVGLGGTAPAAQAAANPAKVVWETHPGNDPRVLDIGINSPSADGPLKWVRVLLPDGWSKNATRTWPTLWLLHGGGGNHHDWTSNTDIEQLAASRDIMVVMPETSGCSSYSDWWNLGAGGSPKWETYLLDEVRDILERDYRAGPERAIAGLSMGGLGALKFTATHPGMFRAAASFSGPVHELWVPQNGELTGLDSVKLGALTCVVDWKRVWGEPGYPFQNITDPTDLRQRSIWEANNPYHLAPGLAGVPLYISYGDGRSGAVGWTPADGAPSAARCTNPVTSGQDDAAERTVHGMNTALRAKLGTLGIPATYCSYQGTHTWPFWERELHAAWPMLMTALGA